MVSRKIKFHMLLALTAAAQCLLPGLSAVTEFDIMGRIESVAKENNIVILLSERPRETSYYIIQDKTVYGTIEIESVVFNRTGRYTYRAAARYTLTNRQFSRLIRAGVDIALVAPRKKGEREFADEAPARERGYRRSITTDKDRRQMVLVPEGKFVCGSNNGDRDEMPEHTDYADNFYIDVHEVSNQDYLRFVEAGNVKPPLSWQGGRYREGEGGLPVMVTYFEAEAYARWAGKRLPTEKEWEKAARGPGRASGEADARNFIYPWGRVYGAERANGADFWADEKTGAHLKKRFGAATKGLMPVNSFDPEGASPCGALNMAGNAREWTSSWYMPYEGNRSREGKEFKRYGKQFKVVRGGSWYSQRYRLRVSSREIGGMPNLYSDNMAGFRCVKDVEVTDREKE
ncbi:MAG TPA: SUMF1/EgtB/PvdO family nonheme iron enzyme [Spirochaetota bacterium]|nr:SUMF1/EgtB/PvdO family nonheme iron enzyme [Spirochaetota bacterium]HPL17444.1 SUMF1/EgtB/PvdO family nonheme iron enzyme [Spirochaetota bacterium]HQF07759.1 SUMF1/EgtB/PvdO family nonheme iron enzyme [Spirochaetota bacterium]HQH96812.1 SUMF1/EgtB/PvdO family nonheme iron enzyme [Spirochaetota bacterium]HQJ70681.1 SUMF1/EgtB/PvdO family nonheme iron enzyme [Spirochaetota bacterium]